MKKIIINLIIVFVGAWIIWAALFYSNNLRGVAPVIKKPPADISEILDSQPATPGQNSTEFPLKIPDDFKIEIFARDLPGARVMAFDRHGDLWVTQTAAGIVSELLTNDEPDKKVVKRTDVFTGLRKPHGIFIDVYEGVGDYEIVYVAEEHRVSRAALTDQPRLEKIADLPTQGGGHFTRTINSRLDDKLYVSIGSSCNVCNESDERRAAIYSMNRDGSDFKKFASGLRNTVFFTWDAAGRMWGTDMGRDLIGDDIPPEEINVIEQGNDYGWPICYGNNIHDTSFDKNQYFRDPCEDKTPPRVEMQAHSAPLGLAFIPNGFGPKDWEGDLIVAFHGSWNRSTPTGYKLVRVKLDEQGNFEGIEDFISGWLKDRSALGRPVDVVFHASDLFVSDDKAGVIYKITYR